MSRVVTSQPVITPVDAVAAVPPVDATLTADQSQATPPEHNAQPAANAALPPKLGPCLTEQEAAQLNWKQIGVLENLAQGLSVTDAARLVKVSRNTIYQWLHNDTLFLAAYNRWKRLCQQSAEARLLALQETAIDIVAEQLVSKRDGRLALALLKSLRLAKPVEDGPTSPALLKQQLENERLQARVNSSQRAGGLNVDAHIARRYLVEDDAEKVPERE